MSRFEPAPMLADLRHGHALAPQDLVRFAAGLADGSVSDAQAGAFAMGVCAHGLGAEGRVALTRAMRDSGEVLRWDLPGPILDKHSTGGIGDCVSLVLAPMLACCGAYVPMISGRGLGHTGGTLDKLEAVPGVCVDVDAARLAEILRDTGCAIVGANADIAPADRRLYAIRDVTGTVDHIDLITASILSKKLAAGLEGLVLDVKCGSGAFMPNLEVAQDLARALVETANGAGCPTTALITAMDQPLAPALGNGLEIIETMRVLEGGGAPRLRDVAIKLGTALLAQAGITNAQTKLEDSLSSGAAMDRFGRMIHALGGPTDMVENWQAYLPAAPVERVLKAPHEGALTAFDGTALGRAVVGLGGGRVVQSDTLDYRVGLSHVVPLGTALAAGDPILRIHAATEEAAARAEAEIGQAIEIGADVAPLPLILAQIGDEND